MSYSYENPFSVFGEIHNEGLDYISSNYNYGDPIENLIITVIDFIKTKTGNPTYTDMEIANFKSEYLKVLNLMFFNSKPLFSDNVISNNVLNSIHKIHSICTSGANLSTVLSNLATYQSTIISQSIPDSDMKIIEGMLAVANKSGDYWGNVISNVGTSPWDPWLGQYDPNYDTAAPFWTAADAIGFGLGCEMYRRSHTMTEDPSIYYQGMLEAGVRASIISSGVCMVLFIVILLI